MGCGKFGGCNGGSGTSGKGRTPYTPQKSSSSIWDSTNRSTGASRTAGKASEIGSPKIRMNFRSRTSK